MNTQEMLEALDELSRSIASITNSIDSLPESTSSVELAEIVNYAHSLKANSSDLLEMCQSELTSKIRYTKEPIRVSGATVEIKQGSPRKTWDHSGLTNAVSRRIMESSIDLDTGEVTRTAEDMMKELLKYAAVSYWRVSELKNLNIDADDYCEVGEAKKSVIVRRDK